MSPSEIERAKSICQHCPVRRDCLANALLEREDWGIWGGYTRKERERALEAYGEVDDVLDAYDAGDLDRRVLL